MTHSGNSQLEQVVLALDAQGGDAGPGVSIPAAGDVLASDPRLQIIACGRPEEIEPLLRSIPAAARERIRISPANSVLAMGDGPRAALRAGSETSLWNALEQVSDGAAHGCVSAGSTAAMLTLGRKLLGLMPGIERPALMSALPSGTGQVYLLDLGANLTVTASQLVQFAVMGTVTVSAVEGIEQPRVGLLNVGHEDSKGHSVVQEAHEKLRAMPMNYAGFIEGDDLFKGNIDVAVCDGFSGNLVLKSSEGAARMLFRSARDALAGSWKARIGVLLARGALGPLVARFDPAAHNGAPLLGLAGVLVKSHGGADRKAMGHAIEVAAREARWKVPDRIERLVRQYQPTHDGDTAETAS